MDSMNTALDVDIDWDIDEELENKKRHLTENHGQFVGDLAIAYCGEVFRIREARTFHSIPADSCGDCAAALRV